MNLLKAIQQKRVLILGMGQEGISTLRYLRKQFPDKVLGVADTIPKPIADTNVKTYFGEAYLESIADFDIVIKSPGIPYTHIHSKQTYVTKKIFTSHTALFFAVAPGQIIGVTGTKGKSTTASLIHAILTNGGIDSRLGGNIGIPALDLLDNACDTSIFVLELSSHQLYDLPQSPHISVIQNIVPEHLDYYKTFHAYWQAKSAISQYQHPSDIVLYNPLFPLAKKLAGLSRGKHMPFTQHLDLQFQSPSLPGEFNTQNIIPAVMIGRLFHIPEATIAHTLKTFTPLQHRLEKVATIRGVSFYNDSLATIPQATIGALSVFTDTYVILIAGGFDRGQDFTQLADILLNSRIRGIILLPATGKKILNTLISRHSQSTKNTILPTYACVTTMDQAVEKAFSWANIGDVILLSPASASFGVYTNYAHRGACFRDAITKLETKHLLLNRSDQTVDRSNNGDN